MLNSQEITNILALIKLAPIKGEEALTVAILQQKLTKMLSDMQTPSETPVETTPKKSK